MRRLTRWALPLVLAVCVGHPASARRARLTPEQAAAVATVEQEQLPALQARQAAAKARVAAIEAWFRGDLDHPSGALPRLGHLPLLDPNLLAATLVQLDAQATARAAERIAPLPAQLPSRQKEQLRAARTTALDTEDHQDTLTRRFVVGLLATTEAAPGLHTTELDAARAALRDLAPAAVDRTELSAEEAAQLRAVGDAVGALEQLQGAVVRRATIPGDTTLAEHATEARLQVSAWLTTAAPLDAPPISVAAATDRLKRLAPLVEDPALTKVLEDSEERRLRHAIARVQQSLAEASSRTDTDAPVSTVEVADARLEGAQREVVEARTAWSELQVRIQDDDNGVDLLDALTLQLAASEVQLAETRVASAEADADRARQAAATTEAAPATTDDDVAQAKADADAALADAERAAEAGAERAAAELREQIARFAARRAEVVEARKLREDSVATELGGLSGRLGTQQEDLALALAKGPLEKDRQTDLDKVFSDARSLVSDTRRLFAQRKTDAETLSDEVQAELDTLPAAAASLPGGTDTTLVSRWRDELEKLRLALAGHRDTAEADCDRILGALSRAKSFRRLARQHASTEARSVVQTRFFEELAAEAKEIPDVVDLYIRDLLGLVRQAPTLLLDLGALAAFVRGSFELVVLVLLWAVARDRARQGITAELEALRSVRPGDSSTAARINDLVANRGVSGRWQEILEPTQLLVRHGVDALAGLTLYWLMPTEWHVPRLLLFIWLARKAYLFGTGLVEGLLVLPGETRVGLVRVSITGRRRAVRTTQAIFGLFLIEAVLSTVVLAVLDADRLHDLVQGLATAAAWALTVVLLHVWAEDIQEALQAEADDPLAQRLAKPPPSPLLRFVWGGAALVLLLARKGAVLATNIIEQRAGLGWVRTAMARQSLKTAADAPTRRLPRELTHTLALFDPTGLSLDAPLDALTAEYTAWCDDCRRGMVAVTGARGAGKTRLLARLPERLGPDAPDGLPLFAITLDRDIFDAGPALDWLLQTAGVEQPPPPGGWTIDSAHQALVALPRAVFVVDDLHRCFLRAVGGFLGLRQLLTVMHATSDHHFWVCAFHGDNWAFLEGIGDTVNLGVFRSRVRLAPLPAEVLGDWLEAHTRTVGLEPGYDDLAADAWAATDPDRARQRARSSYFRLLAEATRGNPRVALDVWVRSLRAGVEPGTASVVLLDTPPVSRLADGGEHALFVLAALVIHDGLGVSDLVRVLNLDTATCRATCRRLESVGVLVSDDDDEHFDITMPWSAVVHRHLRQKHLLHRE